eukprot:1881509-Pyramimonas_sp.AAC.1
MRRVAARIEAERLPPPTAAAAEDRLGCTMKFVRAVEAGRLREISACLLRYLALRDHVDNPCIIEGD